VSWYRKSHSLTQLPVFVGVYTILVINFSPFDDDDDDDDDDETWIYIAHRHKVSNALPLLWFIASSLFS